MNTDFRCNVLIINSDELSDRKIADKIRLHLLPLKEIKLIRHITSVADIAPGSIMEEALGEMIRKADLILLIVSPDFVSSNVFDKTLVSRDVAAKKKTLISIYARYCHWEGLPIARMTFLPDKKVPILSKEWDSVDYPYKVIATSIRTELLRRLSRAKAVYSRVEVKAPFIGVLILEHYTSELADKISLYAFHEMDFKESFLEPLSWNIKERKSKSQLTLNGKYRKGDTLAYVHNIQYAHEIEAPFDCEVIEIDSENGEIVEYDQVVCVIKMI